MVFTSTVAVVVGVNSYQTVLPTGLLIQVEIGSPKSIVARCVFWFFRYGRLVIRKPSSAGSLGTPGPAAEVTPSPMTTISRQLVSIIGHCMRGTIIYLLISQYIAVQST